ncbi:diguanylate cyclase domain-containing protein [Gilvimarinus sp. DA14]|uniref:GGDEF domain-containing response regulator n=1 Tax=Gilvimarinus sp. DA14 TaxID=2956798 RepID=UPI0020B6F47F|nr:diguanylate cyclase [Gilvimarinus sp. DA14]UTF61770.1 diguanylate cyclase [Gilvimarinus sp. DA14]
MMMTATDLNQEPQPLVLLVDDTPANLDVLVEHLSKENIDLMVATSGQEGLELAHQHLPDLILLDVMMPGMDGYTMCEKLMAEPDLADIPVVFLTSRDNELDVEHGLSLGAVDYIVKPFSLPILKARVRNHLALKRRGDLLTQLACTDGLTRVANRRHFDQTLTQEWARAQRSNSELALVMIDIDEFKPYNDRLGHTAGDACLRQIAQALKAALHRPGDLLARYGGEEFVALLPDTDLPSAALIAEQMRLAVQQLQLPHPTALAPAQVSVSMGVASTYPCDLQQAQDLLELADEHLYQAKRMGRNRVYC